MQLDLQKVSKRALLGMISEDLAISKGIQVGRTNLLLVSLIVAVGMKIVGTLLVGFLVIVPAAAAKNLSSDLFRYSVLSAIFGAISSFSGVLSSSYLNQQSDPLFVVSGIIIQQ